MSHIIMPFPLVHATVIMYQSAFSIDFVMGPLPFVLTAVGPDLFSDAVALTCI
jgi:hypothetical protein